MAEQTRNNEQNEQQDLSQILQVRREKLKALQDEGRDPFHITKYDVTHHAQRSRTASTCSRAPRSTLPAA